MIGKKALEQGYQSGKEKYMQRGSASEMLDSHLAFCHLQNQTGEGLVKLVTYTEIHMFRRTNRG